MTKPKATILIVEDEPVSRRVLAKLLKKDGYSVTAVENGRQALEAFEKRFYPIILTDWLMPEVPRVCKVNSPSLIDRKVVPDFRAPDVIRFGAAPLYTRFVDVWEGFARLREVMEDGSYRRLPADRSSVT